MKLNIFLIGFVNDIWFQVPQDLLLFQALLLHFLNLEVSVPHTWF